MRRLMRPSERFGERLHAAQWPTRQTQPLPCCCHWPGTQAVAPGGTATYCPLCQIQGLPVIPV